MTLIDFDSCPRSLRVYGGSAGRKSGIVLNGKNYLVKFPGSVSGMRNVNISYTNSPLSEYVGSHVYEMLGIDSHKTSLGYMEGKLVVACEDFLSDSDRLYEFAQLKVTFIPHFVDSNGDITNGTGTDLQEILLTIRQHDFLKNLKGVEERFWDMFVLDAFIGNPDRNNGNWGIIFHSDKTFSLAPVYDNGNSFNNKWDDDKMARILRDENLLKNELSESKTCVFTLKGKRINPYHDIKSFDYDGCNSAILRLVPIMQEKIGEINDFIKSIPNESEGYGILSDIQKEFFLTVLNKRLSEFFIPLLQRI